LSAGELQPAGVVVHAQHQRADLGRQAVALGEAADDELLAALALELEPAAAAARVVGRVSALGDHAFEPHLARAAQHAGQRRAELR
jgi:hypothetical protein